MNNNSILLLFIFFKKINNKIAFHWVKIYLIYLKPSNHLWLSIAFHALTFLWSHSTSLLINESTCKLKFSIFIIYFIFFLSCVSTSITCITFATMCIYKPYMHYFCYGLLGKTAHACVDFSYFLCMQKFLFLPLS